MYTEFDRRSFNLNKLLDIEGQMMAWLRHFAKKLEGCGFGSLWSHWNFSLT